MTHPPKTLALLISLIGSGVGVGAHASSELRVLRNPLPVVGIEPQEQATTALELTRWSEGLVWRDAVLPEPSAAEIAQLAPSALLPAVDVPEEPGTALVHPASAAEVQALAAAMPPGREGPWQRIRSMVRSPGKTVLARKAIEAPPLAAAAAAPAAAATPKSRVIEPIASIAADASHADRLMQTLSAVLTDDLSSGLRERALATIARRFPAAVAPAWASDVPSASSTAQAVLPTVQHRDVRVASPADQVLRKLEAILSPELEVDTVAVTTQAERALATLQDIVTARTQEKRRSAREERHRVRAADALDIDLERLAPVTLQPVASLAAIAAAVELPAQPAPSPFGGRGLAVSAGSLDRVRGGFVTDGLNISFGIERAVYVNGALVTSTTLNVNDLGRLTAGQGTAAFDAATLALIQSGAGNLVTSRAFSGTSLGSVVQNTLDGQQIQNVTVINATVNSLGVLRGLNLQSSLRGAVIDSLRR